MKMEQTGCSETSAYKIQMPGNYPEESIERSEHGKSLKSRNVSTGLSLHSLTVCDWAYIPTIFVISKFSCLHNVRNTLKCLSHI